MYDFNHQSSTLHQSGSASGKPEGSTLERIVYIPHVEGPFIESTVPCMDGASSMIRLHYPPDFRAEVPPTPALPPRIAVLAACLLFGVGMIAGWATRTLLGA